MLPIIFFAGTAGKTVLATTARGEGDVLVLGLIFPALGHWIENPFYRLPKINRNNSSSDRGSGGSVRSARQVAVPAYLG
jgi:hypothetical protein